MGIAKPHLFKRIEDANVLDPGKSSPLKRAEEFPKPGKNIQDPDTSQIWKGLLAYSNCVLFLPVHYTAFWFSMPLV